MLSAYEENVSYFCWVYLKTQQAGINVCLGLFFLPTEACRSQLHIFSSDFDWCKHYLPGDKTMCLTGFPWGTPNQMGSIFSNKLFPWCDKNELSHLNYMCISCLLRTAIWDTRIHNQMYMVKQNNKMTKWLSQNNEPYRTPIIVHKFDAYTKTFTLFHDFDDVVKHLI